MGPTEKDITKKNLARLLKAHASHVGSTGISEPESTSENLIALAMAPLEYTPTTMNVPIMAPRIPQSEVVADYAAAGGYSMVPIQVRTEEGEIDIEATWAGRIFSCKWTYWGINPNARVLFVFRDPKTDSILGQVYDVGKVVKSGWNPADLDLGIQFSEPWRLEVILLD